MKLKNAVSVLVALGAMSLMCVTAQAAIFSAGAQTTSPSETVTVPVSVAPSVSGTDETLNGYIIELTYDSTVLTPVVKGTDALGEDCYAVNALDSGVFVADVVDVEDTTTDKVVVSWADESPITVSTETQLASVSFKVNSEATASSTEIGVTVTSAATDSNTLADVTKYTTSAGTITLSSSFLRGDANGDKTVDAKDSTLIMQYLAELDEIDSAYLEQADANADDSIDTKDSTLIMQSLAGYDTIPE